MANRRMIHASIWQDEDIAGLTDRQQLLFIGLFSNADDQGRLQGHPMLIRSLVFPYRDISSEDMLKDLGAIPKAAAVLFYEVEGKSYIQLTRWWEYQQLQWAKPSTLPAPNGWADRIRVRSGDGVRVESWPGITDNPDATPDATPVETPVTTGGAITEHSITEHSINENENENLTPTPTDRASARGGVDPVSRKALESIGIQGQNLWEMLKHPRDLILGWCAYAEATEGLTNPAGFVISKLREGEEPPELRDDGDWYTQEEYEKHIAAGRAHDA